MPRIVLDPATFKVLASDTRLGILKSLDERQKTVTELSRDLGLNKATVFEHLTKLAEADIVVKLEDPARKWVYYKLSWKGRSLLHPETSTFGLMLVMALAGSSTAMLMLGNWLRWWSVLSLEATGETDGGGSEESFPPSAGLKDSERSEDSAADSPEPTRTQDGDVQEMHMTVPAEGDNATAAEASDGGWFQFFGNSDFQAFALLALIGALLLASAAWVRREGRRYRWSPLVAAKREGGGRAK